jgi:hypothetical protein
MVGTTNLCRQCLKCRSGWWYQQIRTCPNAHTRALAKKSSRSGYERQDTYVILWSIPQYTSTGLVVVMGTNVISPVNLLGSILPKSSSPFCSLSEVVGANEMAMRSCPITPWENKLSVTVGTVPPLLVVLNVKSTGPMPRIPSKPYCRHVSLVCWF